MLRFPGCGCEPAGAIQYCKKSAAFESGTSGKEIFCGHADSGGRGRDCGGRALFRRRAGYFVGDGYQLADDGGCGWLSDGEHLALLQFQGHRFSFAAALPLDRVDRHCIRFDMVFFPAGAIRHRHSLHGFGRALAAAVDLPSQGSACTSGVPGGISHSMTPISKVLTPVSKSAASQADLRGTNLYRVAIVGAASLKGKEVAEILRDRNFPAVDIRLLDDDESLGQLEAVGEEMNFIQSIRSEQFERVDFTFFAADQRSTRNNWKAAHDLGDTVVDLSYALEDEAGAGATIRSPWIERER